MVGSALKERGMCLKALVGFIGFVQLVSSKQASFTSWYKEGAFNDLMPPSGYQPDVRNARSIHECGLLCGLNCVCLSFFYARNTSVCQLHNLVLSMTTGLNSMPSSQYYIRGKSPYPSFTCPDDDMVYRTVKLADGSLFTYTVYRVPKVSQAVALSNCEADHAHLVRLTSSAKMDVLKQIVSTCPDFSMGYWVDLNHINASDVYDVNQWTSSVGIPLPIGNDFWHVTQPEAPTEKHCVGLAHLFNGQLRDAYCDNEKAYICEKD